MFQNRFKCYKFIKYHEVIISKHTITVNLNIKKIIGFFIHCHKLMINSVHFTVFLYKISYYKLLRYFSTAVMAFAPSDAAVIICRRSFVLMSPAANTPGILVSQFSLAIINPL